jgi:hypothetical protein
LPCGVSQATRSPFLKRFSLMRTSFLEIRA